jgi:hypothetical protein
MKKFTLLTALLFGFNILFAQINLEEEIAKGNSLEIKEGMTLVYGMDYFGKKADVYFHIKSLNHQVVFDYEGTGERKNSGTIIMAEKALEMARAQDNYYHEGGKKNLENQTTIWVSKLVFDKLVSQGEVSISTDGGASQVRLIDGVVQHNFPIVNVENTETNVSCIYAATSDEKVKYWVSMNEDNPVILRMEMGWSIWLKEVKVGK